MNKIVFFVLLLFVYCKKEVTLPAANDAKRIEYGTWTGLIPSNPQWTYTFDNGLLIQRLPQFNTVLLSYEYPYAIRTDTIFIGGDTTNQPRRWVVSFLCDSVVQVTQVGAIINQTFYLKQR
jgi:hypothetical protein